MEESKYETREKINLEMCIFEAVPLIMANHM